MDHDAVVGLQCIKARYQDSRSPPQEGKVGVNVPAEATEAAGQGATVCGTLIVGGGPAGYSTAIMLARLGHRDITVLERLELADMHDKGKSYSFGLDFRSKTLLDSIGVDGIQETDPFTPKRVVYINLDGSTFEKDFFGMAKREDAAKYEHLQKYVGTTWISRPSLVKILYERIRDEYAGVITVHLASKVTHVTLPSTPEGPRSRVRVHAEVDGQVQEWHPKLLVAADGIQSAVRKALESRSQSDLQTLKFPSPSAGLHFKILGLPANPQLKRGSDEGYPNDKAVVLPGKDIGMGAPLRIGMLPNLDLEGNRSANFVLLPDHKLWSVKTADSLYDYLERSFPQMDVRRVVSEEEAERFASAQPGKFPEPQYCNAMTRLYPQSDSPEVDAEDPLHAVQGSMVVLVGDAAHCFPPDLGQGVNCALQDISVLKATLEEANGDYHAALRKYERARIPNVKALVRLMQFGAPYQYRQANKKLEMMLWTMNYLIRTLLNKLFPSVFEKHVFGNFDSSPDYALILERYEATTRRMQLLAGALLFTLALGAAKVWEF